MWGNDEQSGRGSARPGSSLSSAGMTHNGYTGQTERTLYATGQERNTPTSGGGMAWRQGTHGENNQDQGNQDQDQDEEWNEEPAFGFAGIPGTTPELITEAWYRVQARQLIREFLRSVPRSEPEATLAIIRSDGTQRLLTRRQLTEAIDRMRPRQRQIMRLAVEERWSRQRVCAYLQHISIKTFERDQIEALDALTQL